MCSELKIKKVLSSITFLLFFSILMISCEKNEPVKKPDLSKKSVDTMLSAENIQYLENGVDIMEYLSLLKKFGVGYTDYIATPNQYEPMTDRKKMLMRFGMLTADIAYAKVIGGKTQLPEYDKLFQRYVKDLNISSFIKKSYDEYIKILAEKKLDDNLFNELKGKFRQDRNDIINSAKNLDEEFVVYYTIGLTVEQFHYTIEIAKADKSDTYRTKIRDYVKANGFPMAKFYQNLWNIQKYSDYASKLKPAFEIMLKNIPNGIENSMFEKQTIAKTFTELREEILK